MIDYLKYLDAPVWVGLAIIGCFVVMQLVGELLEFKGKIVPEFLKIRKYFSRRKKEKIEATKTLNDVRALLNEVNKHYSADNISKRNDWMELINNRIESYDKSIVEIGKNLDAVTQALKDNTMLTEELFVQSSRDRVIDFATKVSNTKVPLSREEFNRIFKVYAEYEKFLEEHEMSNGEIDIAHRIIMESYEEHLKDHSFIEDLYNY